MSKAKLLCAVSLLVGGGVIATAIVLSVHNWPTAAPSPSAGVDSSDTSESVQDAERFAPYTIEGQEIERGYFPYIIRRISVAKSITAQELQVLLLHQLEQIRKLDYGPMPEDRCAFTVHAYCEPANARSFRGPRLATISLHRGQDQPDVYIDEQAVAAIKEPPQLNFGYEDDVRRQIYWALVQANHECSDQSDREFPELDNLKPYSARFNELAGQRAARFDELWQQRQEEIAKEYELNREQTDEIQSEGMRKHWPEPE